jgi:ABC-2 type transport system permease protein
MSSTVSPAAPPRGAPQALRRPAFWHLLQSEWTKLRSVRSTVWTLILLVVLTVGITALVAGITAAQWAHVGPGQQFAIRADPITQILGPGLEFGQLTIIVLGVLVFSSEYSTGAIRSSLLAVPRRVPMLVAKAIVFAVVVFVIAEIVTFVAFFLGAAILHSHAPVSLSDPNVLRAVVGAGLYLTVLGLFSMAIGGLVRHTAGAITGTIGFVIVLEPLSQLIPGTWGNHIHDYLPTAAGRLVIQTHPVSGQVLSAWGGFALFCAWTVALLITEGLLLKYRDA